MDDIPPKSTHRFAVLFVDDEEMALETFDMICNGYFRTYTAANAQEAASLLQEHGDTIAICISDQQMPMKDGVDLLKETREKHPEIVRILTTAYVDHDKMTDALNEAEIFRYIPKPWNIHELRRMLGEAMERFLQNRQKQQLLQNRRDTVLKVAGQLAHELRGTLGAIDLGVSGIRNCLPELLATYDKASAAGIEGLPVLYPRQLNGLSNVLDTMTHQVSQTRTLMELILSQACADKIDASQFNRISMKDCVETALAGFPFSDEQRRVVHADLSEDFVFYGSTLLMVHLLLNLLRNALAALHIAGKGEIRIWLQRGDDCHRLYLRDGGTGIAEEILPMIFEDFYSTQEIGKGSGIGLGFCRLVVEAMQGTIECRSVEREFTEFVVSLPLSME